MKLSEQIDVEYDKADALSGRCDIPRDTLLGWKNELTQLKAEIEKLREFEGEEPVHLLRLCATTMDDWSSWDNSIVRARANWLRRFASHITLLTGE